MSRLPLLPISTLLCAAALAQSADTPAIVLASSGPDYEGRLKVSLVFNDATDALSHDAFERLAKRLRVTAQDGAERPFGASYTYNGHEIAVRVRPGDTALRVTLAGTEKSPARSGQVAVPPMFIPSDGKNSVTPRDHAVFPADIRFSQKLDPRQAPPRVTATPAIPGLLTHIDGHELVLTGAFPPRSTVRVKLESDLLAEDGWVIKAGETFTLEIGGREAAAAFEFTEGVLSPKGSLAIPMTACNIAAVRLHTAKISPENLVAVLHSEDLRKKLAETAAERVVPLKTAPDEVRHLLYDLRPSKPGQPGVPDDNTPVLGVHLLQLDWETGDRGYRWHSRDEAFLTVTDIALTPHLDQNGDKLTVWATGLSTGKPLPGVAVEVRTATNRVVARGVTDADGLLSVAVPGNRDHTEAWLVTGALGDDFSYVKLGDKPERGGRESGRRDDALRDNPRGLDVMLYGERALWRGGETVRLTGIARTAAGNDAPESPLEVSLHRHDGTLIARSLVTPNRAHAGFFHADFPVSADVPYGHYVASVSLPGAEHALNTLPVTLAPFEPLRLRTALTGAAGDPVSLTTGETLARHTGAAPSYALRSVYRFGAPAAGLRAHGVFRTGPAAFTLPAFPGFTFGFEDESLTRRHRSSVTTLDADGLCRIAPDKTPPPGVWRLDATGVVTEPAGRTDTASARVLWFTAPVIPGIATDERLAAGSPITLRVALADDTGKRAAAPATTALKLTRVIENWTLQEEGGRRLWRHTEERVPAGELTLKPESFKDGVASGTLTVAAPGRYEITAALADGATARRTVRIDGPGVVEPGAAPHRIEIGCAKTAVAPGAAAELTLRAPFTGTALLTLESDRVLESRVVDITSRTMTLPITLPAAARGAVWARLRLVRPLEAKHPSWKPVDATGELMIAVDHTPAKLDCSLAAPGAARPGAPATVTVHCANAGGKPVAVHCWAVDTGVLDLTRFKTPDPFDHFFAPRANGVDHTSVYDDLLPDFARTLERIGAGDGSAAYRGAGIRHRKPVAIVWDTVKLTDASGRLTLNTTLPDHTGALRWMAVAAQGDRYGAAAAETALARPVQVETSAPAFLAPGDTLVVPVALINTTGKPLTVALTAESTSPALGIVTPPPATVTLPAGKTPWRGSCVVRAGTGVGAADLRITATGDFDGGKSVERLACTVRHALPTESRTESRFIPPGGELTLASDTTHFHDAGSRFLVHVSDNALQRLAPQYAALVDYPHGCVEQSASRLLALAAAGTFGENDPAATTATRERIDGLIRSGLGRLALFRRADGGLAYWPNAEKSDEAGSVRAAEALVAARRAGIEPDAAFARELGDYLRHRLYATETDTGDQARLCATLAGLGIVEHNRLRYLSENAAKLDNAALAALALAWHRSGDAARATALLTERLPKLVPAATVTRGEHWSDSSVEADALVLRALAVALPDAPATAAYANALALIAERDGLNTYEQGAVLAAVADHARSRPGSPDAPAEVRLAGGPAAVRTPFGSLWRDLPADRPLVLKNTGKGVATVTAIETGVARRAVAMDHGIRIRRTLHDAVTGEPLDPAKPLSVGQAVLVKLALDLSGKDPKETPDVAVTDLLPACLETDGTLVTAKINGEPVRDLENAANRCEVREDRVLLFLTAKAGMTFEYLTRVVAAGRFTTPPPQAQSMYRPDIRSVGESGELTVAK